MTVRIAAMLFSSATHWAATCFGALGIKGLTSRNVSEDFTEADNAHLNRVQHRDRLDTNR